ncbi:hypothetical protein K443DRAFT_683945 [Laccaria amethystina LaAM-08-1]|uniref:Uncharacterized protein n=1 Tax=Laccaria amethystina LaAM-08-1 TaxID=1095629 RepID=A0A0C9XDB5_9AGAR|nr:hypothetical protein K443DRAFT_683945 [Laccaria amethystina LaAM-08-1]
MPRPGYPKIETGVRYICADKVIVTMAPEEIDTVALQLQSIQAKMATVKPTVVGLITGDSYRNEFWPP